MRTRSLRTILAIGALLTVCVASADAPKPLVKDAPTPAAVPAAELPAATTTPSSAVPLTADDLSAFLDGMLPSSMAIGNIAGAAVAVVQNDRLLFSKGYGFANVEKRIPVSAEQTLFRPASISKLFAWTGVMQQVEAGKLDLDHDINDYLDFKIVGYGGKPILLRHLMTHTAGFEESLSDLLVDDASKMRPLEVLLKEGIPERIYPPGAVPAYSNYGAALAGYIVARAAGTTFDEYIEQHIFQPLQMTHSTFRQPVPAALAEHVSTGYKNASGAVVPFEFSPDAPAGALSATATDMAQFMLAHLNDGVLPQVGESSRILQAQTTQRMHSVANRVAPGIDAMAHGFYEQNRNGIRVIAHGGDLVAFHSELVLIPAAKVGLFISFNSPGKDNATYKVRTAVYEAFMDRYFPRAVPLETRAELPEAKEHARAVAGSYELSRRADSNLFSFVYMLGQQQANAKPDGTLEVGGLNGLNDEPKQFREVEPWLWQEVAGEMRLAVLRDENGTVQSLVPDGYGPVFVLQRTPSWRNKAWLQPAILVSATILAIAAVSWLVVAVRRRFRRGGPVEAADADTLRMRRACIAGGLLCLLFAVLIGLIIVLFSADSFWVLSAEGRPLLRLVQLCGLLAVLGAIAAVAGAAWSWRLPGQTWRRSLGRTLVAASCLVWAYTAVAFHFLSLRLHY